MLSDGDTDVSNTAQFPESANSAQQWNGGVHFLYQPLMERWTGELVSNVA